MKRRAFLSGVAAVFTAAAAPASAAAPVTWETRVSYTSAQLDAISIRVAEYWAARLREAWLRELEGAFR